MRRLAVLLTLVFLASSSIGCRGLRPHSGLILDDYQQAEPVVTHDHRGEAFLVLPEGQTFGSSRYVVLRGDDHAALFYAWPVDERTARLRSASPDGAALLETDDLQPVDAELVEDLAAVEGLQASVGLLEGGKDEPVRWLGPAPARPGPAVLATARPAPDTSLGDWLVGVAELGEGGFASTDAPPGQYLVFPEAEAWPAEGVVAQISLDEAPTLPLDLRAVGATGALDCEGEVYRWQTIPIGMEAGADYVFAGCPGGFVVAATSTRQVNGLSVSLTEDPLRVTGSADDAVALLAALAHARRGQLLTAAVTFPEADVSIAGSRDAVRLRRAELVGAAGFFDWARHEVIAGAEGIHAGGAYYLAKAAGLAGQADLAGSRARRALTGFDRFPTTNPAAAEQGRGRSHRLLATLAALEMRSTDALSHLRHAAASYTTAGDQLAAAEAELSASSIALSYGPLDMAVKLARLARSRFYHGGSPYFSAFAELRLAEALAATSDAAGAKEMSGYALLRFEELDAAVGANRARMIMARLGHGDSAPLPTLVRARTRARELGDKLGVALATVDLFELGYQGELPVGDPAELTEKGEAVAYLMVTLDDPTLRRWARQALAVLCIDGWSQGCEQAVATGGSFLKMSLQRGLQHWEAGSIDRAAALGRGAQDATEMQATFLYADAQLFGALVNEEPGAPRSRAPVEGTFTILRNTTPPAERANALATLARRYAKRGWPLVAIDLFEEAGRAAAEAGQNERRRELVWESVELLRKVQDWDRLLAVLHSAEPVIGGAGPGAVPQLARLLVHRVDATARLGREADAAQAGAELDALLQSLEASHRVGLRVEQARFALERGDLDGTSAALKRVEEGEGALEEDAVEAERRALWRAQIALVTGRLALERGAPGEASASVGQAADLAAGTNTPQGYAVALDALSTLADTDPEEAARRLRALGEGLAQHAPDLLPRYRVILADLEVERGEAGAAWSMVQELRRQGEPLAADSVTARCLSARAAALAAASEDDLDRWLQSCVRWGSKDRAFEAAVLLALRGGARKDQAGQSAQAKVDALLGSLEPMERLLSPRDTARLALAEELSASSAPDDSLSSRLRAEITAAKGDPRAMVRAVTRLADLFLDAGRPEAAEELLDAHSGAFYQVDEESEQILVRLRLRSQLRRLNLVDTLNYATRALSETPLTEPKTQAEIHLLLAHNDVLLGRWHQARVNLAEAASAAKRARDRKLQRRIKDFAQRFTLELPAD